MLVVPTYSHTSRNAIRRSSLPIDSSASPKSHPAAQVAVCIDSPQIQITTLTHIHGLEPPTPSDNDFNTNPGNPYAASNGEELKLRKMMSYRTQRRIRHGRATEGEIERFKLRQTEGEDFG